jgi:hypothetical protein
MKIYQKLVVGSFALLALGCGSKDEGFDNDISSTKTEPQVSQGYRVQSVKIGSIVLLNKPDLTPDYLTLEDSLRTLTAHCHEFIENSKWADEYKSDCGIIIPETKETDDRISGKGKRTNGYNPESISLDEGFMTIRHSPGQTPEIILNGATVTHNSSSCYDDSQCFGKVIKQIRSTDARNGNHLLEKTVNFYAKEVAERYDHGVKR